MSNRGDGGAVDRPRVNVKVVQREQGKEGHEGRTSVGHLDEPRREARY